MPNVVDSALRPSHRPTREWPLLILAVALVLVVCVPLWQWSVARQPAGDDWSRWSNERIARLLLGPEQIACYACFTWACFIILSRYLELRRQRQAFQLDLLPTEPGVRILPEDARAYQRKIDQAAAAGGPYMLTNILRLALGKYAVTRSSHDVSDTVKTQAELDLGRLVTSISTLHYLAWAIPALGFLGTVRGLAGGLSMAGEMDQGLRDFIDQATRHLNVAFDCTLVALLLSLILMFLVHSVQRDEEALVIDAQQYALENLVSRLYVPQDVEHETTHGARQLV